MEYMPNFKLHRPETVEDAVKLHEAGPDARYYAGGTDMIVNVRRGIEKPGTLIDLTAVKAMKTIAETDGGLVVGAAVTLAELAAHPAVKAKYRAVSQAAGSVAGPTHRDYGTVGGNLCLDTRCLFYNQSEWWRKSNNFCLKHIGEVCHVAPGGKRCFAAFSGDVAPAMLVHEAEIELVSPAGTRRIPLADLYRDDGRDHLTLKKDELLTAIYLPASTAGIPSSYVKSRIRGSIDFPLAGVAVRVRMEGGKVADLKIALTGVNPSPHLVKGAEKWRGRALGDDDLDALREEVRKQAKPMKTTTVAPWYRRRVVGALARRLVSELIAG